MKIIEHFERLLADVERGYMSGRRFNELLTEAVECSSRPDTAYELACMQIKEAYL